MYSGDRPVYRAIRSDIATFSARRQPVPFRERHEVIAVSEGARFVHRLVEVRLKIRRQLLVVPRRDRIGRQETRVLHVVPGAAPERAEVDHGRHEHDAVELDAVARLQITSDSGRAHRPIAFAEKILWRRPPLELREVEPDELGERFDVLPNPVKLLRILTVRGAAEPRRDRVDGDDIGHVEERVLVVDEPVWRRGLKPLGRHLDPPRPEHSHVQPDRRGARPAVVREGNRPGSGV